MENNSLRPIRENCNNACEACCEAIDVAEINATAEAGLRHRALTLSSVVAVMLLAAHILFAYQGKKLEMPDIAWVLVLAPWGGATMGKLGELFFKGKK